MQKHQCRKCNKTWYGWARNNICPHCGGELIQLETSDHIKNEVVNKKTRTELSDPRF